MLNSTSFCAISTQSNSIPTDRYSQPKHYFHSIKISTPIPCMTQRQRRHAKKSEIFYSGMIGGPRPSRFVPTDVSHASMVLKIRKQIDPAFFLPVIVKISSRSTIAPYRAKSNFIASVVAASTGIIPCLSRGLLNTLGSMPSIWSGLPVAQASDENTLYPFDAVASFKEKFTKDFFIQVSPSLIGKSLMGATIMVGEIHHQANLQELILKVLTYLQPERGDKLLMEGGLEACPNQIANYGIPAASCINLEEYSAAYLQARAAWQAMTHQLKQTVHFVATHLPRRLPDEVLVGDDAFLEFIKTHAGKVIPAHKAELDVHLKKCQLLINSHNDVLTSTTAPREKEMLAKIKENMGRYSLNVAVLGAQHVVNLASYTDEKIIFMMPRLVHDTHPEIHFKSDKDEF